MEKNIQIICFTTRKGEMRKLRLVEQLVSDMRAQEYPYLGVPIRQTLFHTHLPVGALLTFFGQSVIIALGRSR